MQAGGSTVHLCRNFDFFFFQKWIKTMVEMGARNLSLLQLSLLVEPCKVGGQIHAKNLLGQYQK